jgi:hypothetical protein
MTNLGPLGVFVLSYPLSPFLEKLPDRIRDLGYPATVVLNPSQEEERSFLRLILYILGVARILLSSRGSSGLSMAKSFLVQSLACTIQLISLLSPRRRGFLYNQIVKSGAVKRGQVLLLESFLDSGLDIGLLLEDDFEPIPNFNFVIETAVKYCGHDPFSIELAIGYTFSELGVTSARLSHVTRIDRQDLYRVSPGASNTTASCVYSRKAAELALDYIKLSQNSRLFADVPVDFVIADFYKRGNKLNGVQNYHVVPGVFNQLSDFRRTPWYK